MNGYLYKNFKKKIHFAYVKNCMFYLQIDGKLLKLVFQRDQMTIYVYVLISISNASAKTAEILKKS